MLSAVYLSADEFDWILFLQNDMELKPGKTMAISSQGCKRSLVIHKCTYQDQGEYLCRTADDNTAATLTVHGTVVTPLPVLTQSSHIWVEHQYLKWCHYSSIYIYI